MSEEWKVGNTTPQDSTFYEGWAPQYTQPIRVIDSLVRTLPLRRRRTWRRVRDAALALWRDGTGLELAVEQGPPITWTNGYQDQAWPSYYTRDAITFVQCVPGPQYPQATWAPTGPYPDQCIVSLAMSRIDDWWKDYEFRGTRQLIAHEFGHALGFGHGGDGVMMGALKPNAEELACIRTYYA